MNGAATASTSSCDRQVAGAIDTSRRWRVMTSVAANETDTTRDSPWPRRLGRPGPPTMTATPATAIAIAIHVRRLTGSPRNNPIAAARMGASAWKNSTFATDAWFSATRNEPEASATRTATAMPPRPIARNALERRRRAR